MRKSLLALVVLCPILFASCASRSSYISVSKPNKDGKVVVVGAKELNMVLFHTIKPRAWLVDVNTGNKTDLEVVFE